MTDEIFRREFYNGYNERSDIMNISYEEIMDIIEIEKHKELLCAETCKWIMKRTLNPIRKIRCYFDAKRFMGHVFGIDLVIQKLKKAMGES